MDVAIYLRKSRADMEAEKAGQFETLRHHERILQDLAKRQNLTVLDVYKELLSGESITARPEVQRLLYAVSEGKYQGVLVVELERLARGNTADQAVIIETFKSSECLIITPEKTYDPANSESDENFAELGLMLSRFEYKTIKKRLKRGKLQAVKEGTAMQNRPPFGYKAVGHGKNRKLVPDENAQTVRDIFTWYAYEGLSIAGISRRLYEMGVPSLLSPSWSRATLYHLLKNETYLGCNIYGKQKYEKKYDIKTNSYITNRIKMDDYIKIDNCFEPVISQELFNAVQNRLKLNAPKKKSTTLKNPLAGLLRCPRCGRVWALSAYIDEPRYYHGSSPDCRAKSVPYKDVMTEIIKIIKSDLQDKEISVNTGNTEEIEKLKHQRERIETAITRQKVKLQKIYQSYEDDVYTKDEFIARRKQAGDEIKRLETELQKIVIPDPDQDAEILTTMHTVIESLASDMIPAQDKNELLKSLVKKIELTTITKGNRKGVEINVKIFYR